MNWQKMCDRNYTDNISNVTFLNRGNSLDIDTYLFLASPLHKIAVSYIYFQFAWATVYYLLCGKCVFFFVGQ